MDRPEDTRAAGLLLAAGAGRRMGTPKGLLRDADGVPWVARSAAVLLDGGCAEVVVVTGAAAAEVAALLPADDRIRVATAPGWATGMGASLIAGLDALEAPRSRAPRGDHDAGDAPRASKGPGDSGDSVASTEPGTPGAWAVDVAVVHLVDLPDVGHGCVARVLAAARDRGGLTRASFGGRPGHPVALGRDHWAGARAAAVGDRGARDYLDTAGALAVDCSNLAGGRDVDTPARMDGDHRGDVSDHRA